MVIVIMNKLFSLFWEYLPLLRKIKMVKDTFREVNFMMITLTIRIRHRLSYFILFFFFGVDGI